MQKKSLNKKKLEAKVDHLSSNIQTLIYSQTVNASVTDVLVKVVLNKYPELKKELEDAVTAEYNRRTGVSPTAESSDDDKGKDNTHTADNGQGQES